MFGSGIGYGGHLDQLGAAQAQRVLLFLAFSFRNDDHGAKTHGIADECEPDAGVARRALDDDAAGPQLSFSTASSMMNRAARSFTDWPGSDQFGLAENGAPVAAETRSSLISGVLPIASTIPSLNCIVATSLKGADLVSQFPKFASVCRTSHANFDWSMIFSENRLRHLDQVRGKLFRDQTVLQYGEFEVPGGVPEKVAGGTSKFKDRTRFMRIASVPLIPNFTRMCAGRLLRTLGSEH